MTQKQRRAKLDREISEAKKDYREDFRDEHGYIFCESCGKPEGQDYIDVSHMISLAKSLELAAEPKNFSLACRTKCHPQIEVRNLTGLKNEERLTAYIREHDPASLELKALEIEIKSLRKDAA